ncbi:MAG: glucoamylase family protein [Betaproteobacteria bacterium]
MIRTIILREFLYWKAVLSGLAQGKRASTDEQPLRSALLSAGQMEQHAKALADAHRIMPTRGPDQLLARLAANESVLIGACNQLTAAATDSQRITPAGEWLLDNFYLIEEQIRTAKRHLPKGYSRELPRLARGDSAGLPRVYDIALQTISHGDGQVDPENLGRFVSAYQTVSSLKLGELWAIPIMLRLALIENLRRVAVRISDGMNDRNLADSWAGRMTEIAEKDPKNLVLVIADMARSNPPMTTAFVAEFVRKLQGQGAALALPLTWIERLLSESQQTIEQLVHAETQKQASAQVSISNSIASLRFLSAMDWREFVEAMSLVEETLRSDPQSTYANMDFATRDRYRHAVERIATRSPHSELEVAQTAIRLARESAAISQAETRHAHVGFYLIDEGLPLLEHAVEYRKLLRDRLIRSRGAMPISPYLGSIVLFTLLLSAGVLVRVNWVTTVSWMFIAMAILLLLATSQLAMTLVNRLVTLLVSPDLLPRMDYSKGIPAESRTLVVVPTMITSRVTIEELVEALEVRFLANRNDNLHFALLTDFRDATTEVLPADEELVALVDEGISALNEKYSNAGHDHFFLFHRPRRWNAGEATWMGYERKRGKLADLNALLRGGDTGCFSRIVGDISVLAGVKYVITLDSDTQLPRDSARQFASAMAHPLNRAEFDLTTGCVKRGYGILQPRVAVSMPSTEQSRYARLFGSEPGIDPYTRAISDVYQDLFGEGSFVGKGIYDVDAFERALKGRFPENRVLSHDLLEGCYVRSALLSDVQLYEEYPSRYSADVSRRHRWIRGDWQIASWLLGRVPTNGVEDASRKNPLSALSQWKIFDNLRRSLVPAATLLLLMFGWTQLSPAWLWTTAVIGIFVMPILVSVIVELMQKREDVSIHQYLLQAMTPIGSQLAQAMFTLACLPFEAAYSLDAIIRTNWRIFVTHKRLLEWTPSASAANSGANNLWASYRTMWVAPVIAIATAACLLIAAPTSLLAAMPILLLWVAAPALAWWLSLPRERRASTLSADQLAFLHKNARKTWGFFETFVGPDDHWLPPDNYQEYPVDVIAHRTSPTNMGLALLANLAAYDFGYIPAGNLIERTANTLTAMASLTRHRGHFYNWYDTQSMQPLLPLYISSVDSGNLVGHLLTLRAGLLALPENKLLSPRLFAGLSSTLSVLKDDLPDPPPAAQIFLDQLNEQLTFVAFVPPVSLAATHRYLTKFLQSAEMLAAGLEAVHDALPMTEARRWAGLLISQCQLSLAELTLFVPWSAVAGAGSRLQSMLDVIEVPTLRAIAHNDPSWLSALEQQLEPDATEDERKFMLTLRRDCTEASRVARERISDIDQFSTLIGHLTSMETGFLYDRARHLFTIGYSVSEHRADSSYYDMLASEARLGSFVAIAQGKVPQESWFALGRLLTATGGEPALLSWSGSMFEYLMPMLVMPTFENTLLDRTNHAAVERQIVYGAQRGVPWGISESGYNTVDAALNYQYRAFGVPGLGLKRGLADDLVVTPYASALALMVAPERACANLQQLADNGLAGKYGFYEAIDYTPARLPRGQNGVVIRSFMAHHQGMVFLSLAYLLLDQPMQKRFMSDPMFQATVLLLQERVPKVGASQLHTVRFASFTALSNDRQMPVRLIGSGHTSAPEVQLLSNNHYRVMVTNAGGGYSRWRDLAVTRWREDSTADNWGMFCYIRDEATGAFWSNTHQPTLKVAENYEAIFSEGRAEFRRRDLDYDTYTEIVASPEDAIELRRVCIFNRARTRRTIEVTSYAEVVLANADADALHPAFSNLFVQTEIVTSRQAILCTRRPRSQSERSPWLFHLMAVHGATVSDSSYETDRSQFVGRGRDVSVPIALTATSPLSGSQGSVLDPIVAIRCRITLEPRQTVTVDIVTGVGETRDEALTLIEKYQDRRLAERVFELSWTHCQVVLRQINATEAEAQLYTRLANSVVYANSLLRADASVLIKNRRTQSGLWGYAISGDLPIVLLQISDPQNIELVRQLVKAHAYWRLKGLVVDLVIWNEDRGGYRQLLQEQIMGLIAAGIEAQVIDRPGGIFVRSAEHMSIEDRNLFESVARVVLTDRRGSLADQINRRTLGDARTSHLNQPLLKPTKIYRPDLRTAAPKRPLSSVQTDLLFDNGLGGFSPDGREYVITVTRGKPTPAPWANVLANQRFGTVISESGMAYTWSDNAHEFRLTPWHNDPVSDLSGEAFYLRDEESGHFWSPTPLPCGGASAYESRHGFGVTTFVHTEDGICTQLVVTVSLDDAIKFSVLTVSNESGRPRRLSATGYVEWVLGDLKAKSNMHVITEIDALSGALCARNTYNTEFGEHIAFFDVDQSTRTFTGDRVEFLGRNGTLGNPAAMTRAQLSNRVGAGLDPCAAIQVEFELADGEEHECVFMLGDGRNLAEAQKLLQRYRGPNSAHDVLDKVKNYWLRTLGAVQVETPDASLNVLLNGWLVYQTMACRLWARSGYYQSGGAYGFRDQLQDVMALVHTKPSLMREHLLLCASRQFKEGDVQHWWHPPSGRGVRTHCADDYLWLPLATARYVLTTGDTGVLSESVRYLEGREVNAGDDSYYDLPNRAEEAGSLYRHCVRAIEHGLTSGAHGLPLIGSGDWNDGMNMVGQHGKGESIWLGFFLCEVLRQFTRVARLHGDTTFAERCLNERDTLAQNLEKHGWDGEWYRRAYFDDGTPLGSATNDECQIDSIAQSWSVLSGVGEIKRTQTAMNSLDARLVRRDDKIIQLLDPPFDKSDLDPGYIRGYVPGVRENGGQYTHGAIWAAMAFAAMGDSRRAWELTNMINPISHATTTEEIAIYKVEPYVIAADVYGVAPHTGRGGWSWYTGSAGWMYRLLLESLLGLRLDVDKLTFTPCLPVDWPSFSVQYRYRETVYQITVIQTVVADGEQIGATQVTLDGIATTDAAIALVDDGQPHTVEVRVCAWQQSVVTAGSVEDVAR